MAAFVRDPAGKKAFLVQRVGSTTHEFQFRYDGIDFYVETRTGRYQAVPAK